MLVNLAYGKTGLPLEVPEDRTTVIGPKYLPTLPDESGAIRGALRNPIGTQPLRQKVRPDHTVAIAVCDITRPIPSHKVLPVLLNELSHIPDDQIVLLVATGTHRANTSEELEDMLGAGVTRRYRVVNHDARDGASLKHAGETPDGIPILLNRRWLESDVRITVGFVEPHLFAGFSGGPKLVAPGLSALETIMHLHTASIIAHPKSRWGIIEDNPLHSTIRQIAGQTGVDFSVDVSINRDRGITGVYAGELFTAHRAACEAVKRTSMRPVSRPFEVIVTTNSGYPLDLNLYQAIKGVSAAAQIVRDGGTIICAAECIDGIPEHGEYKQILASRESPEELLEMITSPGYSRLDQWQVQTQAQIQLRADVYLKSTYLEPEQVRAAHIEPVDDLEAAVSEAFARYGDEARLCVLPEGPQTIPYLE